MKIALVDPRTNDASAELFPHLGLGYLAAVASQGGHSVTIFDLRMRAAGEGKPHLAREFDVVGITATSFTFALSLRVAGEVRQANPTAKIVIGGPHVSIMEDAAFASSPFDFAVAGEGEGTFAELLDALETHGAAPASLREIAGLIHVDDGRVVRNQPRAWIEDLDSLPLPEFDSLDMGFYTHFPIITSRGCPFRCAYCFCGAIWGKLWRSCSAERIFEEITRARDRYGWTEKPLAIVDDTFNLSTERVEALCDLLKTSGMRLEYYVWGFRADKAPMGMLQKMSDTGCISVSVGIESANRDVLKRIKKGETIDQITETLRNLRKVDIYPVCLFMIGNPGDTLRSVMDTFDYVKKNRLYLVAFNMALPYPKTDLWDFVVENGRFIHTDHTNFHHYSEEPVFETPEFPAQERTEAYRLARRLERIQRLKFELERKARLVRRGDFRSLKPKRMTRSVRRFAKYAFDLLLGREPTEKL